MERFILDETAATRWLDLVVAASDGDVEAAAKLAEVCGEWPAICGDWDPTAHEEESTLYALIRAAAEAEVITRPDGVALEFEYLAEDYDGGLYRFGVIFIEPVELNLSSHSEEMRYLGAGESGAEAALAILKDAVETANMVLHQLSGYVAVQVANEINEAALVG